MVAGLRTWRDMPSERDQLIDGVEHPGWRVEQRRAPLGVIGFVFEGRPNVFADATGVLRGGNTVVFRIGRDALGTAIAIHEHALVPALAEAGLPVGAAALLASPSRATGYAMFSHPRLALAVARGSGPAVAELGAVARQAGVPVSLHGTGGAWLVAGVGADADRFAAAVTRSLDRKVCNTLNVCCIVRDRARGARPSLRRRRGGRGRATGGAHQAAGGRGQRGLRGSGVVRADGQRAALDRSACASSRPSRCPSASSASSGSGRRARR